MSVRRLTELLRQHWPLVLALAVGLALRIALWGNLPRQGLISDEAEYLASADWLAHGRGFAWHTRYLWTRAPLYPLFLAAHLALFGRTLGPIFFTQSALSLLVIALTYTLTLQLTGGSRRAAGTSGLLAALYLPLASYAQLLLSETLFITLLLAAFVLLGVWRKRIQDIGYRIQRSASEAVPTTTVVPSTDSLLRTTTKLTKDTKTTKATPIVAFLRVLRPFRGLRGDAEQRLLLLGGAGLLLGLATLTRGLTVGFLPFLALWLALTVRGGQKPQSGRWLVRALGPLGLLFGAWGLIVLPWSLYATRAYGGPILIDTTGAFNLALGARTAYDGGRSDEPTRSFVLALLDPGLNEEQRRGLLAERRDADGQLTRAAACLYAAHDAGLLAALAQPDALTQADRQRLLSAEALCLIRAKPLAFVTKSLTELVDLFQINYSGDERLSRGFALGRLPAWYVAALFFLDDTLYVLALPLAVLGWARLRLQPERSPTSALLTLVGLWLLFNLAAAPLLFAINRFRVPLMPFAFALAGAALTESHSLKLLRTRYGAACATLAGLLFLVAAAPFAYLEPRAQGQGSRWASYLGPSPSSLSSSLRAIATRQGYLREQELAAALGSGDVVAARAALQAPGLPTYPAAVGAPLLDGLVGQPAAGLDRLASASPRPLEDWQTAVVAGELFRQMGDLAGAKRELGPTLVDSQNPVDWSWVWLNPPRLPADRIDLADDNDLGYIRGFYLGRYDPDLAATTRWASGEAALRFPGAGTAAPRTLCLRLSGLGWPSDLSLPTVQVSLDGEPVGSLPLTRELVERCLSLPARPAGSNLIITLRSVTFVPDALDLIAQQGPQVGQLRLLAYQLDRAELR